MEKITQMLFLTLLFIGSCVFTRGLTGYLILRAPDSFDLWVMLIGIGILGLAVLVAFVEKRKQSR